MLGLPAVLMLASVAVGYFQLVAESPIKAFQPGRQTRIDNQRNVGILRRIFNKLAANGGFFLCPLPQ